MSAAIYLRYLGCTIAAAVAAGCNGGSTPSFGASAQQVSPGTPARYSAAVQPRTRSLSWMSARAHHRDWLVYASDGAVVDVIADVPSHQFPGLKYAQLVDQLSGFGSSGFGGPYFQCLGASSAHSGEDLIFIVDSSSNKIYEYGWGETQPLAVQDLSPYISNFSETGCASDSTTQNVALAGVYSPTQGQVGVLVFAGGLNGTPEFYADPQGTSNPDIMPPAYDGAGNLFFEDQNPTKVSELPAGQQSIVHLSGLNLGCASGVSYLGGGVLGFEDNCINLASKTTAEIIPAKVVGSSLQQVGSPVVLSQGAINGVQCNNFPHVYLIQWSFVESHSAGRAFILGSNVYCGPAPLDVWDFSTGKYLGHFPTDILANSTWGSSAAFLPKDATDSDSAFGR
jgi:hypothetical protein